MKLCDLCLSDVEVALSLPRAGRTLCIACVGHVARAAGRVDDDGYWIERPSTGDEPAAEGVEAAYGTMVLLTRVGEAVWWAGRACARCLPLVEDGRVIGAHAYWVELEAAGEVLLSTDAMSGDGLERLKAERRRGTAAVKR